MAENKIDITVEAESKGVSQTTNDLEQLSQSADKVDGSLQEMATSSKKVGAAVKESTKPIKKAGEEAKKSASKFNKLAASFKRILLYRTIRAVLKEIFDAFKVGVANVYQYSDALGRIDSTRAANNLDSLATSALYVKNSIGAAMTPVIQAVTPIIYRLANAFATAANACNQLFAALNGNGNFTYAKRSATQFAESLASGAASAGEMKRTLLGFDEINRLDAPDTGGGGGGAEGLDASNMFDEGVVSEKFKKIANIIKTVILPAVAIVGAAIAAWFVSSKLTKGVETFLNTFTKLSPMLSYAFAPIISGVMLIVGGLALIVAGVVDVINTGGSLKSWCAILGGIALVVTGVALAFGGIPALITGIVLVVGALGLFITKNWDDIKTKGHEVIESVKQKLSELWQKILSIPIIGKIAEVVGKVFEAIVSVWQKIQEIKAKIWEIFIALGKAFYTYALKPIIDWLLKGATWVYDHVIKPIIDFLTPIGVAVGDFIGGAVKSVLNAVFTTLESGINGFIRMLNGAINIINKIPNVSISRVTELSIPRLANGGYVGAGQMFIARESGPELVGSMNGHTAVANNQQIIQGIKQGVMEAMQNGSNQNIVLNVDGKQLFDIMVGRNNSIVRTSGRSPLLV